MDEPLSDQNALFFGQNEKVEDLASLHPPVQILPKLRDIYADRVDPLVKILHLPTFLATLENGLRHPSGRSDSLEAIMFAFYLAVVSTLDEDECQDLFGVSEAVIHSRYRLATRQALVNAGFLSTSNPLTLQAYVLFMVRIAIQPCSLRLTGEDVCPEELPMRHFICLVRRLHPAGTQNGTPSRWFTSRSLAV